MREGWTYKKLGEVADVFAGQGAPQGESNYCLNGTPFVKAGNLIELINGKPESSIQNVSDEVAASHKLKLYKAGSVLFAKSGMSCMKGYVYTLKGDCYVVSHLAVVTPHSVDAHFLNYYLNQHKPNSLIKDEAYPSISLKDIENLKIPVPPHSVQQSIVSELDLLSGLIAKHDEQLKAYDELAQSIFYDMFGDPVENEKGWEVKKLEEVATIKSGYTPSSNELKKQGVYPYFKVGEMNMEGNEKFLRYSNCYLDSTFKSFPKGSIVFPKNGAAIATNKKRILSQNSVVDLNTAILISKQSVDLEFLYYWICQVDFRKITRRGAVPTLDTKELLHMNISLPPLPLQTLFAEKIEAIERQKERIRQSMAEVKTLFDSRMDYYFN